MAYNKKKYTRINWKNRPSTATALGATNLNHMDVFLNDVDNALIEMDAGKLNVETANSMIASITFDKDKGLMTVRELNGTTYTYDWNVEKIPVSFSLSEDGILTMTTQDGTQFTANIADLIKDYVFDDSDTIAFTKEFQTEDNSYHVGASVKNGSIKAQHLDPDYRADIQNFSNVAQTAANDALTYSKDSKRWAVGDAAYEGSEVDNSKYYKEQAEIARAAAEKAREEAESVVGFGIATTEKAGIVKPDGVTISVDEDGTIHGPQKFEADGYVYVTGESAGDPTEPPMLDADTFGGQLPDKYVKKADLETGFTQTAPGQKVADAVAAKELKDLIDQISQKVLNDLVSNESLTQTLAGYVTKAMMSNVQVNDQNRIPTSALVHTMQTSISKNAEGIAGLNNNFQYKELTNDFDLNNALGKYRTDSSIIITSLKNKPSEIRNSGEATIDWYPANERNTYGIQIMRWTYGNTHMIFTRNKIENTWAEWVQYVTKSDLTNNLNHKKQILPWGNYRDGSYSISNFTFGSNLYIAVGTSAKVQKRCSIISPNDSIQIPHPEGFITIVFNDTNHITVSGTTGNYQLREIRASDLLGV